MFRNYYILNRQVCELNERLSGVEIQESYSQDKNKLFLKIASDGHPDRHLIISVDQNLPYISIKNDHRRAKKNNPNLFPGIFPSEITAVQIAEDDRIIKFVLTRGDLYFLVRGGKSNIIHISVDDEVSTFKKNADDEKLLLLDELKVKSWTSYFNFPDLSEFDISESPDNIRKSIPTLGSEIVREIKSQDSNNVLVSINSLLSEIAQDSISVFYSEDLGKVVLLPSNSVLAINSDAQKFSSTLEAVSYFVNQSYKTQNSNVIEKDVAKHLDKELTTISSKLNKLRKRVESGCLDEEYKRYGSLLLANLHLLRKGMTKIEITDYNSGEIISINLNEKLPPNKNVDYYFQKSKDERISYEKSIELFNNTEKNYNELIQKKNAFEDAVDTSEIKVISDELNLTRNKPEKKKLEDNIKYRHFIFEGKYHVYIGRDNVNNDLVTFKMAKQNDIWMHARGLPGSHVVLRIDNTKEPVPKNILKSVASLAAYYSKAKTAGIVPVAYSFRKYVRKKKGMEPGKVIIERETVLLVRPEIPNNCEYIED
ncbi:MAG: DUF814 domain-containing protein [Bacteroidetes bacterium]|nr:DUF814 domain-containing protein [Bacteroidota bacterium]